VSVPDGNPSPGLLQILGDLQARVSALEAQQQGVDESSQPNYLTYDPATGTIGGNFTGLIHALGLLIPASIAALGPTAQTVNQVVWQRTSDGAVTASFTGYSGGVTGDGLQAFAIDQGDGATFAQIGSTNPAQTRFATIVTNEGATDAGTNVQALIQGSSGLKSPTIMDAAGQSSFPQLTAPEKLHMIVGNENLTFPNSQTATPVTFSTGLGAPVVRAFFQLLSAPTFLGTMTLAWWPAAGDQVTLSGYADVVVNATVLVNWLAFDA
jgi:hypothetical protein